MNILLTGATGYIGKRLLPLLIEEGHTVYCVVRDKSRFSPTKVIRENPNFNVVEADLLEIDQVMNMPKNIDVAYYLVHSMTNNTSKFNELEAKTANNFVKYLDSSTAKQFIYLSGIVNDNDLSKHLKSRLKTEKILCTSKVPHTVLRAAIIIGAGSASFEIIRDLVEKLPIMIAPKWLKTNCQPIAIRDVLSYLSGVLLKEKAYNKVFDIGGTDILTYRQMLLQYAEVRDLKRIIKTVPFFSPRLSSYWLYYVTSVSYPLARNLVSSMSNEVVVQKHGIKDIVPIQPMGYHQAIEQAFTLTKQHAVVSSWKDAIVSGNIQANYTDYIEVPQNGVFTDIRVFGFDRPIDEVVENLWGIGGKRGWYYMNWAWRLRGRLDRLVGGVGLRRGRRNPTELAPGDPLDFWRVLLADKESKRLLLFAEMKLPGEAWLEFKILDAQESGKDAEQQPMPRMVQTATFRPHGVFGRLYWLGVLPMHFFIFPNMARNIIKHGKPNTKITRLDL